MPRPALVAHRGYPQRYPENTLPGLEAAAEAGARYLETDVQLTSDREPVLFHDPTVERLCAAKGTIHERTLDEVRRLRAADPGRFGDAFRDVPVATLDDACELVRRRPGVTLFVDVKSSGVRHFGARLVVRRILERLAGLESQAVLISRLPEVLREARGLEAPRRGLVLESWAGAADQALADLEADYLFCDVQRLPAEGTLRLPGHHLAVYDVVDPEEARRLGDRGVSLIETFAIGEMIEALGDG